MPTRNQTRRSAQISGSRTRNVSRAFARARAAGRKNPKASTRRPWGNAYKAQGGERNSAPWLRKMGRAAGFTSGRDSSAERRIHRMLANALAIMAGQA